MPRTLAKLLAAVLLGAVAGCVGAPGPPTTSTGRTSPASLRVMTFNVRFATPSDGPNVWQNRRDLAAKVILDRRPAVVGTQELLLRQARDLADRLPGYAWFGRGRLGTEDDGPRNERMGVFYDTAQLKLLDSGDFWLSETPDVPGSSNFGVRLPRMATWGEFEDLRNGRRFRLFNTHFPHRVGAEAVRERCARLVLGRIGQLPSGEPVVLTGDFNTTPASPTFADLTSVLSDAWTAAQVRVGPENTYRGFGHDTAATRIDWILTRGMGVEKIETVTDHDGPLYPTDHFPVVADLVFEA